MTPIAPFVFPGLRSRVIFGAGTIARTGAEVERLGHSRALVLSTPFGASLWSRAGRPPLI